MHKYDAHWSYISFDYHIEFNRVKCSIIQFKEKLITIIITNRGITDALWQK